MYLNVWGLAPRRLGDLGITSGEAGSDVLRDVPKARAQAQLLFQLTVISYDTCMYKFARLSTICTLWCRTKKLAKKRES